MECETIVLRAELSNLVLMKSAYELAMEKLEQSDPSKTLSETQRARLAEITKEYDAKIAEREVFLGDKLVKARAEGDFQAAEQVERQLGLEVRRLRDDCESAKEKVRQSEAEN